MACSSCNRNNRRRNDWGCRKAVQSARWPSCNSCGGCNSCGNSCGGCSSCGCGRNVCTGCGSTNVCTGSNTVWAQPYDSSRSGWNRWARSGMENGARGYERYAMNADRCFPYYCGPCGPVEPTCGCTDGCGCAEHCGWNGCMCREPVYGFFTQVGTLDVNAGGVIPFNGGSTVEGIWKDGGELTLDEPGVYLVTLSADIPEIVTLYTELDVRVNGVTNPGGRLILDKDYNDAPLMANTQTMITVSEGAVVTVTSSEGIAFSTSDASMPIVTLSLVKLS